MAEWGLRDLRRSGQHREDLYTHPRMTIVSETVCRAFPAMCSYSCDRRFVVTFILRIRYKFCNKCFGYVRKLNERISHNQTEIYMFAATVSSQNVTTIIRPSIAIILTRSFRLLWILFRYWMTNKHIAYKILFIVCWFLLGANVITYICI